MKAVFAVCSAAKAGSLFFASTGMERLHDRLIDFLCPEAGEKKACLGANSITPTRA